MLNLSYCRNISDNSLYKLAKHSSRLHTLDLTSCDLISDSGIISIANANNCPNLCILVLSRIRIIGDSSTMRLAEKCRFLHTVNFSFCRGLSDIGLLKLAEACDLQDVKLGCSYGVTDATIIRLTETSPHLHTIDLWCCRATKDLSIKDLNIGACGISDERCPSVEKINLSCCPNISNIGVIKLGETYLNLTSLQLSANKNMTNASILKVASTCANLCEVDLHRNNNISDVAIISLAAQCPHLAKLGLVKCEQLTDRSISEISK